ncbi:MAG: Gfo/Idh/MocA family protein [Planctomycetota bacterium]
MVKVGILGVGFMGTAHFRAYTGYRKAKVVALCDLNPKRLKGDWSDIAGNIEGAGASGADIRKLHLHADPADLFADPDVEVVDITLPTFLHAEYAVAALEAGKHVVCEKPMAVSLRECDKMIAAADRADRRLFIAHCIRFWPEFVALKEIIDGGTYGKVLAASFWRKSSTPAWSWDNWLMDEARSGGAVVDLHIHDTDYINSVFGVPKSVRSVGVVGAVSNSAVDSLVTEYLYDNGPQISAEGTWALAPTFGFTHGFCVTLEGATVEHDAKSETRLTVHTADGKTRTPRVGQRDGYEAELRHFVDCVAAGKDSEVVTAQAARDALKVTLAEARAVKTGRTVPIR